MNAQAFPKSSEYKSFPSHLTSTVNNSLEDREKAGQDRDKADQADQARIFPKSFAPSLRLNRVEQNIPNAAWHGDLLTLRLADAVSHLYKIAQDAPGCINRNEERH